jgi:coenzyme F420-dependent glucose-6-phosphate dehydrogenase
MSLEFHYDVVTNLRPPRDNIDLASDAVDAGFEGIWMGDHYFPFLDSRPYTNQFIPWFGALMNEIPDVAVGTSVTCPLFRYEPPVFAQMLATLDNMYPGRLQLGVGVGEAVNEAHFVDGEWPDWGTRAGMLVEAIDLVQQMWEREGFSSYDGDYYQYDLLKLYTRPKAPLPVHWAAWGPTSARYAGNVAGNLFTSASPEDLESVLVPNFERGLSDAGRDRSDAEVTVGVTINVGDPDALVAEVRDRGEYVPVLDVLDVADPREIYEMGKAELAEMTDAEIRENYNIVGDPREIVDLVESYDGAGVDRINISSHYGDPRATIETFEDDVFPRF